MNKRTDLEIPKRTMLSTGLTSFQYVDEYKKELSRDFRKNGTEAEIKLWGHLRNRKVGNYKFRRQQVIEGFVADFFCESAKLVVEIDGDIHDDDEQKKIDQHRTAFFKERGLYTLRLKNEDILYSIDNCLELILKVARDRNRME